MHTIKHYSHSVVSKHGAFQCLKHWSTVEVKNGVNFRISLYSRLSSHNKQFPCGLVVLPWPCDPTAQLLGALRCSAAVQKYKQWATACTVPSPQNHLPIACLQLFTVLGAANVVTGQKRNLLALAKVWYNQFSLNALKLMESNKSVSGYHLSYLKDEQLIHKTMLKLLELYEIRPHVDSCYHFEEIGQIIFACTLNDLFTVC